MNKNIKVYNFTKYFFSIVVFYKNMTCAFHCRNISIWIISFLNLFKLEKRIYLPHYWSDKGFKGTVLNRTQPSIFSKRVTIKNFKKQKNYLIGMIWFEIKKKQWWVTWEKTIFLRFFVVWMQIHALKSDYRSSLKSHYLWIPLYATFYSTFDHLAHLVHSNF